MQEVGLSLRPGSKGTKKLVTQYGNELLCVRYRYDRKNNRRLKTVELVVENVPWIPPPEKDDLVYVPISYNETELRERALKAHGRWNPKMNAWRIRYDAAVKLGLRKRIIEPAKTGI